MAKYLSMSLAAALIACGCTTASLQKYTLDQINTIEEYRINATLDCLATVAATPDTLPSFSLVANGFTHLQDTGTVTSITTFTRLAKGFATESWGMGASRSPTGDWGVDPVASFSQLDALRAACRWAVFGPEAAWNESPGLLLDPTSDYSPQRPHFGVANRLSRLPPNWVHVGRKGDVPKCAAYSTHCCDTYIWIMPQERWAFFEFMLVMHDIATIDPEAGVYSPPLLVTITRAFRTVATDTNPKDFTLTFAEVRAVRPEYRQIVEERLAVAHNTDADVGITEEQWLNATYPYFGQRTAIKAASNNITGPTPPQQAQANAISAARYDAAKAYLQQLRISVTPGGQGPPPNGNRSP